MPYAVPLRGNEKLAGSTYASRSTGSEMLLFKLTAEGFSLEAVDSRCDDIFAASSGPSWCDGSRGEPNFASAATVLECGLVCPSSSILRCGLGLSPPNKS